MSGGHKARRLAGLAAVVVGLAVLIVCTFRAYQNPVHVVQWLALVQLCR